MLRSVVDKSKEVRLTPMGNMTGNCSNLELTSPIQSITASFVQDSGYGNSIQYSKDGKKKTYGNLPEE